MYASSLYFSLLFPSKICTTMALVCYGFSIHSKNIIYILYFQKLYFYFYFLWKLHFLSNHDIHHPTRCVILLACEFLPYTYSPLTYPTQRNKTPTHKLANLSLSLLGLSPRAQAPCNHYSNCTNPIFPHTPELPLFSWNPMLSTADYGLYSTTTRENSSQHQWLRTIRVTPSCHSTSYLIT